MGRVVFQEDITNDNLNPSPYLRISRSAVLNLSTTWQTVTFNGTSTYNVNTYPMMENAKPSVYLDTDQQTIRFNASVVRTYDMDLDYKVMGGTLLTNLQLRFVVPAPTPIYFPLPDSDGCCDLAMLGLLEVIRSTYTRRIYSSAASQQYGLRVQIRAASLGVTPPQLQDAALFLYGY